VRVNRRERISQYQHKITHSLSQSHYDYFMCGERLTYQRKLLNGTTKQRFSGEASLASAARVIADIGHWRPPFLGGGGIPQRINTISRFAASMADHRRGIIRKHTRHGGRFTD